MKVNKNISSAVIDTPGKSKLLSEEEYMKRLEEDN